MDKIRYFFREAVKNIWVNRMMSIASVGVLAICLILLGSWWLISLNLNGIIRQVESQNQIMAFLSDSVDATGISNIGDQIKAIHGVRDCTFVSKEQALEEEKKSMGSYAYLLQGFDKDNPLPNGYRIVLTDMQSYQSVVTAVQHISGVNRIQQHADVAVKLNNIRTVFYYVGLVLLLILALISVFIIYNTIKLATFARKREINIMKFVGATDWFIRWPFLFEGMLIGCLAAVLAFIAQWFIYWHAIGSVIGALGLIELVHYPHMFTMLLIVCVLVGLLVGMAGSALSMRRYLKV